MSLKRLKFTVLNKAVIEVKGMLLKKCILTYSLTSVQVAVYRPKLRILRNDYDFTLKYKAAFKSTAPSQYVPKTK